MFYQNKQVLLKRWSKMADEQKRKRSTLLTLRNESLKSEWLPERNHQMLARMWGEGNLDSANWSSHYGTQQGFSSENWEENYHRDQLYHICVPAWRTLMPHTTEMQTHPCSLSPVYDSLVMDSLFMSNNKWLGEENVWVCINGLHHL